MTDTLERRSGNRAPSGASAYGLLMTYEQTLRDSVEAVIADGLRQARADVAARERTAVAWREPLLIIAAEELSRRHALRAAHGAAIGTNPSALRRALRPYVSLVAIAARHEMQRQPAVFMAAD